MAIESASHRRRLKIYSGGTAKWNIGLEMVVRFAAQQRDLDLAWLDRRHIFRDHCGQLGLELLEHIWRELDTIVNEHRQQPLARHIRATLALAAKQRVDKSHTRLLCRTNATFEKLQVKRSKLR